MQLEIKKIEPHLLLLVQNGIEILPEFLVHHVKLFHKIHIIDHNSRYDLSILRGPNVKVYRADMATYFQEEYINVLLEKVLSEENPDWIFTLDVDEFLPFFSEKEFQSFLRFHNKKGVIEFSWRNGLPIDRLSPSEDSGVSDSEEVIFFNTMSTTKKCAVNSMRLGNNFYIPRSNHRVQIRRGFFDFLGTRRSKVPAFDTGKEIYHLLSSSLDDFAMKIGNFKRIRSKFVGVEGHGGSLIFKYPDTYTIDDWMTFTASYRSGNPVDIPRVKRSDFFEVDLFASADRSNIQDVRRRIKYSLAHQKTEISDAEQRILDKKKKHGTRKRLFVDFEISKSEIRIKPD